MRSLKNIFAAALVGFAAISPVSAQDQTPEQRSFSSELLADAAGRSSSLGAAAADVTIQVHGELQFRYTANFNSDGSATKSSSDYTGGFSVPLARLRFTGVVSDFDYTFVGKFDRATGSAALEDAFIGHALNSSSRVQFGQFKLPFMREVNVGDQYQLAEERSIVANVFGQGRSQGAQVSSDFGNIRLIGAFSDGFNTVNTDFTNPSEQDLAFTARAEWLVSGDRAVFKDFTSEKGSTSAMLLGVAGHYEDSDAHRLYSYTADASLENGGWNAFVSGVGRNVQMPSTPTFDDYGGVAQTGYRLTDTNEIFGRYDAIWADSNRGLARNDYSFVTGGWNHYFAGQTAKFTLDGVYSFHETTGLSSLGGFSNTGLLESSKSGEVVIRAQFQLLF